MFYRTRSQRPTWNPYDEEGNPASGGGTSDSNPAYFRDKLTQHNGERRQSYNIGFDLDILPKKLVLSGNASLLHYDYQRKSSIKVINYSPLLQLQILVKLKLGSRDITKCNSIVH